MEIKFHPDFWKSANKLFSSNPIYAIPRWFGNIKDRIKWAYQRVVRGYDDTAKWNLNTYIAEIAKDCTDAMINEGMGHPIGLDEDKWRNDILTKIRDGFDAHLKIARWEFDLDNKEERKKLEKKQKQGLDLFVEYFDNLWD